MTPAGCPFLCEAEKASARTQDAIPLEEGGLRAQVEVREVITYWTSKGEEKEKKDFVRKHMTYVDLIRHIYMTFPKFVQHHDLARYVACI